MNDFLPYLIYPLSLANTLLWVWYSKWQFSDDRGESSGKWHPYGACLRAMYFVPFFFQPQKQDIVLAACISIVVFEIGINLFALKKVSIWYVGTTSKFDSLKKFKWPATFAILAAGISVKIFL